MMCRRWWAGEDGRVSAFVLVFTIGILALAGLTLDGGLALAAKVRANGQAEAAARAGAQAIDLGSYRANSRLELVPEQAIGNARRYLASIGATGTVTVSGDTVMVTVTTTQRTQLLGLIGMTSLSIHGQGRAHPQRGVRTAEP